MPGSAPDAAERAFTGRMVSVSVERWGDADREVVERADSIAVVAVDRADCLVLVRQFREAARRSLLELPAGTVDEGEEPLATAKRELAEEIGKAARDWTHLVTCYGSPGFSDEEFHIYLATDLYDAEAEAEENERIEIRTVPLAELDDAIRDCRDAKTLVGLLWFRAFERAG